MRVIFGADFAMHCLVRATGKGIAPDKANGRGSVFSNCRMPQSRFVAADLTDVRMMGCSFHHSDFSRACLAGAHMEGCDLGRCVFVGADLRGADLSDAQVGNADFRGADVRGANFQGADLRWARFDGALLDGAHFSGADIRDATIDISIADVHGMHMVIGRGEGAMTNVGICRLPNAAWQTIDAADERLRPYRDVAKWWANHRDTAVAMIRSML